MESYEPNEPRVLNAWRKLGAAVRLERLEEARRRELLLKEVAGRAAEISERTAIRQLGGTDRTSFRRWQKAYAAMGLDGLIDTRAPPPQAAVPEVVRAAICTLRQADSQVSVETILAHVKKHHDFEMGRSTVKHILQLAGLARRRGPPSGDANHGTVPLVFAGMKLVEAAAVQTGYLAALTTALVEVRRTTAVPPGALPVDTLGRDREGRFEAGHNERFRKQPGDPLGPGFASVEVTRATKDPKRFHLHHAEPEIIERKIWGLMTSPLLGNGRWDGIRVARGDLLSELCGYPYMPSTLDLFTRELKFLGIANTWWEVHARRVLSQTRAWGNERSSAVLFVDETNKPVWTQLFSQASKVSQTGRVMPSLEVVAFHSGYGVPLWQATYSGRAPLVREVPQLLGKLEEMLDGAEVGRIIVIDAEGNSIPFLKGLETGTPRRAWITRLRPDWVKNKTLFNRTNYRAYRNGDRIRVGLADFDDPTEPGAKFRMRVVEIERRSTNTVTYLGASTILSEKKKDTGWSAENLADLYFERWPNQEANFRAVNQAVGSKDVHGYGKQLVDNVSVITALDELQNHQVKLTVTGVQQAMDLATLKKTIHETGKVQNRRERRLATVSQKIDQHISKGKRITPALQRLSTERSTLATDIKRSVATLKRQGRKLDDLTQRQATTHRRIKEGQAERASLESRRTIFRHDVELDSIFALLKVGLVFLVTYALKEYLGDARMEPVTFLERLATLPGRLRVMPNLEILTFDYNHRDPQIMALLEMHAPAINELHLKMRSGRFLRIEIDAAPPARLTPPNSARTNTRRRFHPTSRKS